MVKKTKRTWITIGIVVAIALISAFFYFNNMGDNKVAILETSMGTIEIELYSDMPITTGNFENLINKGVYNGVIFHRIMDGFMIQGGDPTGTGYGDPKIPKIKDEFTHAGGNKNNRGTISMANAGPNTGSSQFFINLVDNNFLDPKHPAFGIVVSGMDVVDKIAKVETNSNDKPLTPITIISARMK
jgi:peptidylprolyl isomerase